MVALLSFALSLHYLSHRGLVGLFSSTILNSSGVSLFPESCDPVFGVEWAQNSLNPFPLYFAKTKPHFLKKELPPRNKNKIQKQTYCNRRTLKHSLLSQS